MKLPIVIFFVFANFASALASNYKDGDIIFQESQSKQSKAIKEATSSRWSHVGILFKNLGEWKVGEAVQPVGFTSLEAFISRGKNRDYRVYRVPGLSESQVQSLRNEVSKFVGRDYDIFFEWSDDLVYCSELVYKTFSRATGITIGKLEKFRDLKLDGPYVKELIRQRIEHTERILDLDEPIVTPVSQLQDPILILVDQSEQHDHKTLYP